MATLAMKFGGSALGNTAALTQVLSIVLHEAPRWDHLLLVVSALDGVTDQLIEAAHFAQLGSRRGYRRIAANIRQRHLALIEKLPLGTVERGTLQADIDRLLFDFLNLAENISQSVTDTVTPETIDSVVGVGEKLAARILAALLRQNELRGVAIDATDLVITDATFGNAIPDMALTRNRVTHNLLPMLERDIIPVLTGYIGGTATGKPTTLGRGGSDLSLSILGVCADAAEVWVWTDVDGIMSADPREIQEAHTIKEMSYAEMAELAYFGARVLHSRMVSPLREKGIALRVKNVYKPQQAGTLIFSKPQPATVFKAVTSIRGIGLSAPKSGALHDLIALTDTVMHETIGSQADVMISTQASAHSFACFVIPTAAGPDAAYNMVSALEARLSYEPQLAMWRVQQVSVITTIGEIVGGLTGIMARIYEALDGMQVLAVTQNPTGCGVSIVIEPQFTDLALSRIHHLTA